MTIAIDIHTRLLELQAERALGTIEGIAVNSVYMADLDGEIEATARALRRGRRDRDRDLARRAVRAADRPRPLHWWRRILQRLGR